MKYSVCTEILYGVGGDIPEAMQRVKDSGFDAYEFWFWWMEHRSMDEVKKQQDALGMTPVCICAKFVENPGDATRHAAYIEDFKLSIEVAKKLDCKMLVVQSGFASDGISYEEHRAAFKTCLKQIAPLCEENGITAIIEPLNVKVDHAGYHLYDTEDAFNLVKEIGSPNVKILFDIYHQQISSGFILESIRENLEYIGHIHAAGCPGRHEITESELDYRYIFKEIEKMGYEGYIGLEYIPLENPDESLKKVRDIIA